MPAEVWDAYNIKSLKIPGMTLIRGLDIPDGMFHLIARAFLVHKDGTILLLRETEEKSREWKWHTEISADVQRGETSPNAIIREIKARTGVALRSWQLRQYNKEIDQEAHAIVVSFIAVLQGDKTSIIQKEADEFCWLPEQQCKDLPGDSVGYRPNRKEWEIIKDTLDKERCMDQIRKRNRQLIGKYPFLMPSSRLTGEPIDPDKDPDYDWSFTELDDMPEGWRKAFGEQMMDDLKAELESSGLMKDFRILQIKEKFGELRFYSMNSTENWENNVLPKYEELSRKTCIRCGRPATMSSVGWISPYCDECAKQIGKNGFTKFVPWEQVFGKESNE